MARPIYSVQLALFTFVGESAEVVDLPGPDVWIMRDIDLFIITGDTPTDGLLVTFNGIEIVRKALPDYWAGQITWRGRAVAPGPTEITVSCTGGATFGTGQISGYQLTP